MSHVMNSRGRYNQLACIIIRCLGRCQWCLSRCQWCLGRRKCAAPVKKHFLILRPGMLLLPRWIIQVTRPLPPLWWLIKAGMPWWGWHACMCQHMHARAHVRTTPCAHIQPHLPSQTKRARPPPRTITPAHTHTCTPNPTSSHQYALYLTFDYWPWLLTFAHSLTRTHTHRHTLTRRGNGMSGNPCPGVLWCALQCVWAMYDTHDV